MAPDHRQHHHDPTGFNSNSLDEDDVEHHHHHPCIDNNIMDNELQHDGDDDLLSPFNTEMADDLSLCSFDNEDMDSSSSTTPSSSSAQQLMMMPTQRGMPVLPTPNDVCFKSCQHPGTVRWRAIIKTYSGKYSKWKDDICTKVREDLALENITTFLVNLDPQGQLSKSIKRGLWYHATVQEILVRTKERYVEDRKQRSKKAQYSVKRLVGRPKTKNDHHVATSPNGEVSPLVANHAIPLKSSLPIHHHLDHPQVMPFFLFQRSLAELVDDPSRLHQAFSEQPTDVLWKMKIDLAKLHDMVYEHVHQRYHAPNGYAQDHTTTTGYVRQSYPVGPAAVAASPPPEGPAWPEPNVRSNPFGAVTRKVGSDQAKKTFAPPTSGDIVPCSESSQFRQQPPTSQDVVPLGESSQFCQPSLTSTDIVQSSESAQLCRSLPTSEKIGQSLESSQLRRSLPTPDHVVHSSESAQLRRSLPGSANIVHSSEAAQLRRSLPTFAADIGPSPESSQFRRPTQTSGTIVPPSESTQFRRPMQPVSDPPDYNVVTRHHANALSSDVASSSPANPMSPLFNPPGVGNKNGMPTMPLQATPEGDNFHQRSEIRRIERRYENSESVEFESYEYRVERRRNTLAAVPNPGPQSPSNAQAANLSMTQLQPPAIAPQISEPVPDKPCSASLPTVVSTPDVSTSTTSHQLSKSSNVSFDIYFDYEESKMEGKAAVTAGQSLTGKVVVNVRDSALNEGKLGIRIKGREDVFLNLTSLTRRNSPIFDDCVVLRNFSRDALIPGVYQIPFCVPLPTTLPTSTAVVMNGRAGVRVAYEIRAVYEVGGKVDPRSKGRLFVVRASPLPRKQTPVIWGPETQEIKSMKFIKKGSLSLGVRLQTSHIGRGDKLEISIACRNHTSVEIKHVQVKLVEEIHWHSLELQDSQPSHRETTVLSEIENLDVPGLAKRSGGKSSVIHNAADDSEAPDKAEMIQELESGVNMMRVTIPDQSRDSYQGKMVNICHFIKIKLVTSFSTENFSAKIPLTIGIPPLPQFTSNITTDQEPPTTRNIMNDQEQLQLERQLQDSPSSQRSMSTLSTDSGIRVSVPKAAEAPNAVLSERKTIPNSVVATKPPHTVPQAALSDRAAPPALISVTNESGSTAMIGSTTTDASLTKLIADLLSVSESDPYKMISEKLSAANWLQFFASLNAEQFGTIIGHIPMDPDRPRVAELLASRVQHFTCQHAAKALQQTSFRVSMAKGLLPRCVDFRAHDGLIKEELNDWDMSLLSQEFSHLMRT